ncbi:uncharacterized protein BCR38DRAFT_416203 [Pseudomassariella vexata]|uniref:FAD/NAD(P)-binding domain-containing protein n=1 Tax=Pseudomassariella vexata TaxID=1141098 RepID=A0A1Y2EI26_9PEZI|nr:uncharacterized protein BCR38DRAFT_416203 [Pseudomassariella vexata]ORY71229.1 hypothetical protein BCR38DRAFT_416203 [Pseudomassariella vexata]
MTKTVVVLGAGLAGLPVAHYLLSQTSKTVPDLRVILVSPNDEFYWNVASVRFTIPGLIPDSKYLFSIPENFAKYPSSKFEFLAGKAERLDPGNNSVVVALNDGSQRALGYHTVVVATGSDAKDDMPWKNVGTSQQTRAAIAQLQEGIKNAESIVVGGAGATGVEFAGELGSEYAKFGKKSVTIISSESLPLELRLKDGVREAAKKELEKMKIKVITDAKVTHVSEFGPDGQKILELTAKDGSKTTLKTDLYVPTHGATYNTQFAPVSMQDANKRLHQNTFLRAPGYENVFVLGDAGNLEVAQATASEAQLRHLVKQFGTYFESGKVEEYKPKDGIMMGVTVGRDRATGQMGNWRVLSLMIWWFKGRYLGTDYAVNYAAGLRTAIGEWE